METNFICNKCGFEFFQASYTINTKSEIKVKGKFLSCPSCGETDISSIPKKGEFNSTLGKFNSMSNADKKKVLTKRVKFSSEELDRRNEINKKYDQH